MVDFEEQQGETTEVPPSQERLLDAEEIEKVAATLKRPTARMHLESLAKKLRKESEALKRVEASRMQAAEGGEAPTTASSEEEKKTDAPETTTPTPTETETAIMTAPVPIKTASPLVVVTSNSVQYVPIDKFAFDAGGYNSAFVTLYIDLPGVGSVEDRDNNITCQFTESSFDLIVKNLRGKSYRLFKDNLENEIDVSKCTKKIKADKILVKLAKKKGEYGTYDHWSALSSKKKKSPSKKDDPAAGIMDLMRDMYEEGDDNMKKVIGETMMKQREGTLGKGMEGLGGGLGDMDV